VTLISAKFGADLSTISKDTDHKTKWPRFFGLPGTSQTTTTDAIHCSRSATVSTVG